MRRRISDMRVSYVAEGESEVSSRGSEVDQPRRAGDVVPTIEHDKVRAPVSVVVDGVDRVCAPGRCLVHGYIGEPEVPVVLQHQIWIAVDHPRGPAPGAGLQNVEIGTPVLVDVAVRDSPASREVTDDHRR